MVGWWYRGYERALFAVVDSEWVLQILSRESDLT